MIRSHGFILIELLIALSICALTMALFVNSSNNLTRMLITIEEKYSLKRLQNDISILSAIDQLDRIDPSAYLPLLVTLSSEGVEIKANYFKQEVAQK